MVRMTRSSARLESQNVKAKQEPHEPLSARETPTSSSKQKPAQTPRTDPTKQIRPKRKRTSTSKPLNDSIPKRVKSEEKDDVDLSSVEPKTENSPLKSLTSSPAKQDVLQAKKLKAYTQYASKSPFPDFLHPTPSECRLAHEILSRLHGERLRPNEVKAPATRAGCGDSPSVLDALVRTILSQNTNTANSTRAKRSMDAVYGGSDEWEKIVDGGQEKLQETIKSGGLSAVKSRVIINILEQTKKKYGAYSLDHLFDADDDDAMQELIGFQGVGPKTASCVLLFCLQRDSFAVDTHVWRITGFLGWRPEHANRDETHAHLDARIPDEEKYGLHILLVKHGKVCPECKAGGKSPEKCELRTAFKVGVAMGK